MSDETNIPLSERAMLACLRIGTYGARATDREITEEVSENHKAELRGAGTYSKFLIAARFFRDVNHAASVARQTHNLLTLPWESDGTRIISSTGYMHYTDQMRLRRINFEAAANKFCQAEAVEDYIKEATVRLGDMFDRDQYPTPDEIRSKFTWDIEINKVPEGADFRTKLSDPTVKAIIKSIELRSKARVEKAVQDIYIRIAAVTGKMVESLHAYEPAKPGSPAQNKFRDTLISNVVELAQALPSLNVTGDAKIDALANQIIKDLGDHSPEVLRGDAKVRADTAKKAEAILNKVKKFI